MSIKEKYKPRKQLKKGDLINCNIINEGAPIINHGHIREIGKNIVALEIDLRSKYCEVSASFGGSDGRCGVYVNANKRSLYLNEKSKRNDPTGIEFSDFIGWDVFACGIGRYTLSVCLIRKQE